MQRKFIFPGLLFIRLEGFESKMLGAHFPSLKLVTLRNALMIPSTILLCTNTHVLVSFSSLVVIHREKENSRMGGMME